SACVCAGTTLATTIPVTSSSRDRPPRSKNPAINRASSSAVRSSRVELLQCSARSEPRKTPTTVSVFPVSTASSIRLFSTLAGPAGRARGRRRRGGGVVDQPRGADARRDQQADGPADAVHVLPRVEVHHCRVAKIRERLRGNQLGHSLTDPSA